MRLIPIPEEKYYDYRINLMFDCYKWDPQFLDNNTIAKYALVLTQEEHNELKKLTEKIDNETRIAEEYINNHQELARKLDLPLKLNLVLHKMKNYNSSNNIRLMRYDFHPTIENAWKVSEVNSDVPRWICRGFTYATMCN